MNTLIEYSFYIATVYQVLIYTLVYSRLWYYKPPQKNISKPILPKVSVLIAARNESHNLLKFLPKILNQNYPNFEVVVVNDRSTDKTESTLKKLKESYPHLFWINVHNTKEGFNPKKHAIIEGVKVTKGEYLLMTDADCYPLSTNWIKEMVGQLTLSKKIVLGFSPYTRNSNFLNNFIQYETMQTAIQYFSYCLFGQTYMGVGRNFLYEKKLFNQHNGFEQINHVFGGDDDLFVQKIASSDNTTIALSKNTFVATKPSNTVTKYLNQKLRHYGVGASYKLKHKFILGSQNMSHFICYISFIALLFIGGINLPVLSLMGLRMGLFLMNSFKVDKKLTRLGYTIFQWIFYDIVYIFSLCMIGSTSFFYKKQLWK